MKFLLLVIMVLLLLILPLAHDDIQVFELRKVIDGDTLQGIVEGQPIRLRLAAIDAPEMSDSKGVLAKAFLTELLKDQRYFYQKTGTDPYGRSLGYLWFMKDDRRIAKTINAQLVQAGFAFAYDSDDTDFRFFRWEREAQRLGKGIFRMGQ